MVAESSERGWWYRNRILLASNPLERFLETICINRFQHPDLLHLLHAAKRLLGDGVAEPCPRVPQPAITIIGTRMNQFEMSQKPVVAGGEAVAIEGAIGSVARVVPNLTLVALYLVSDIEAVRVHQTVLDAEIGVFHIVEPHHHLQITGFNAVDGEGTGPTHVKLVQYFSAVSFVSAVDVHLHRGILHRLHRKQTI